MYFRIAPYRPFAWYRFCSRISLIYEVAQVGSISPLRLRWLALPPDLAGLIANTLRVTEGLQTVIILTLDLNYDIACTEVIKLGHMIVLLPAIDCCLIKKKIDPVVSE